MTLLSDATRELVPLLNKVSMRVRELKQVHKYTYITIQRVYLVALNKILVKLIFTWHASSTKFNSFNIASCIRLQYKHIAATIREEGTGIEY